MYSEDKQKIALSFIFLIVLTCISICVFTNIQVNNLKKDENSTEEEINKVNKISNIIYIIVPIISLVLIFISIYFGWFHKTYYPPDGDYVNYYEYYNLNPAQTSPLLNDRQTYI